MNNSPDKNRTQSTSRNTGSKSANARRTDSRNKAPASRRQSPPPSHRNDSGFQFNRNTVAVIVSVLLVILCFRIFSFVIINENPESPNARKTNLFSLIFSGPDNSEGGKESGGKADGDQKDDSPKSAKELAAIDIAENYTDITVTKGDVQRGNLILINSTNEYNFDAVTTVVENPVPVTIPDSDDGSYWVKSNLYETLTPEALTAIDALLTDFCAATSKNDVMILDTSRSYEEQQNVLNAKIQQLGEQEGRKIATQPGFSEHHSSLALDLTLFDGTSRHEYDGTGDYSWITGNCYKYGFVIRYPQSKTAVTGITYEPWHLRYVGKEHAFYMTKNNLCLEEYITLLSTLPVDSARLNFTTDTGEQYTVYSAEVTGDSCTIKVPKKGQYTLSGDNQCRIIVSCKNN